MGAVLVVTMALAGAGVAQAAWSGMDPLPSGRYNHTATVLNDGRVLVAGGTDNAPVAAARLYDPATNVWSAAASMNVARQGQAAAVLADGKVLVAGGCVPAADPSAPCDYTNTAEIYDPTANTWSNAASMGTGRFEPTMTALGNGKVLVAGGVGDADAAHRGVALQSAELYDPSSNSWSDAGAMSAPRAADTATMLPNGDVLVAGGYNASGELASAELYHDGAWVGTGDLNDARDGATATALKNGDVLVAGGDNGSGSAIGSAEVYSAASGTWSKVDAMAGARESAAAVLLEDGTVLVAGGETARQHGGLLQSTERFDPTTHAWKDAGAMAIARAQHTLTALPDGRALAIGGNLGGFAAGTTSVERFSAVTANLSPLTFPKLAVGTASDVQTSTLSNTSDMPMKVTTVAIAGGAKNDYEIVTDGCHDSTVAPGASCTVDVRFTPSTTGARVATLTVTNNTALGTTGATLAGSGPDAPTTAEGTPQGGGTGSAPAAPSAGNGGATVAPRPATGVGTGTQQSHRAAAARATCKVSTARSQGRTRSTVTCTVTLPTTQKTALRGRLLRGTRTLASAKVTARNGRAVLRLRATSRLRAGSYTVAITRTNGSLVLRQPVRPR